MIVFQIGIVPFVFSIFVEIASPKITGRFTRIFEEYIDELDDDRIGSDAEDDVKEFAAYAFEILQIYTAVSITTVSGFVQLFSQTGLNYWVMISLLVIIIVLTAVLFTRSVMKDPALYASFTEKYYFSPTALVSIPVNLIFISLILSV